MIHTGTKTFESERLICRRFEEKDFFDMHKNWASNPKIQCEYGEPVYPTEEDVKGLLKKYLESYKNQDFYRWAIVEKASGQNIGQIAFCRVYSDCATAEIEYCIGEPFWGKGYAGEALSALVDFTFRNTSFAKLEAYHRNANAKSGRVLEKSRMYKTDNVERFRREGKEAVGETCYCIERSEWEKMEMLKLINNRRSYRGKYKDQKVPKSDLVKIMEAGLAAPSGCNKQTTSVIAVDDPELLKKLKEVIVPSVAETAPSMICVLTKRIPAYRDRCFSTQDYSAAIENMLLAIVELGYQSCWYEGHITDEDKIGRKMADILGVPEDYELVCFLPVGIAEGEATEPKKKSFEERAWFNGFGKASS